MDDYQSSYTGAEIDAGIGKANTSVQPADLETKQDVLVSGTNIKTINSTSILGSGNIDIQTTYEFSPTEFGDGYFKMSQTDIDYIYQNRPTLLTMNVNMGGGVTLRADFIFGQTMPASYDIVYTMLDLENTTTHFNSFKINNNTTSNDNITLNYVGFDINNYQTKTDARLQTSSREIVGAINELSTKFISVYRYKGTVTTYSSLPSTGLSVGDVYNIENADTQHSIKAGDNVAWTDTGWDVLGGTVDLSGYQTLIDSSHKLSSDLVDDTNNTNKFVSSTEKNILSNESTTTPISNNPLLTYNSKLVGFPIVISESGTFNGSIKSGFEYRFGTEQTPATSITVTSLSNSDNNVSNEFILDFYTGSNPSDPFLTLPPTVKWADDIEIEANKHYQVSILNNIALWCSVDVEVNE